MTVGTTPPPTLSELDLVLSERKTRLVESLRKSRVEVLQRIAHWLIDLRLPCNMADVKAYELGRLATLRIAREEIEQAQEIARRYEVGSSQATRAMAEAKTQFDQSDPLGEAMTKQRALENYHKSRIESEAYEEARESIRVSIEEVQRGLHNATRALEPEFAAYTSAKITAMVKEAEQLLEEARGKAAHAQQLQQRAAIFEEEFRQRYGLQEGKDGGAKA